jgi:hypothetical protein
MLVLHASSLVADSGARILANGGGGASGATKIGPGGNGSDPDPTMPLVPAPGGMAGGGRGGNGYAQSLAPTYGLDGASEEGGGGGGGGAGYIRSNQMLTNVITSPDPQIVLF